MQVVSWEEEAQLGGGAVASKGQHVRKQRESLEQPAGISRPGQPGG